MRCHWIRLDRDSDICYKIPKNLIWRLKEAFSILRCTKNGLFYLSLTFVGGVWLRPLHGTVDVLLQQEHRVTLRVPREFVLEWAALQHYVPTL